jgi:putative ABC transport system permease protein
MMIAILIYVGLNERTKEIGILRSLGARKRDIAMIFNLETIIIGFFAGLLGVLFTYLISFPLNNFFNTVLEGFINVVNLRWFHAVILMTLSMSLTFITGFFPSRVASKKHPAEALKYNE